MKTLMIFVMAIAAILAAPKAMADFFEDCVTLHSAEIKGTGKSIFDEDILQEIDKCVDKRVKKRRSTTMSDIRIPYVDARVEQRRPAETNTRYVDTGYQNPPIYRQQQPLPRAAMWRGLGPAKPSDDRLAFLYGVAVVAEKFNRAFNPRDYYGYYGGYGYGGYGYNSYSALFPELQRNARVCDIARGEGHIWGRC